MRRLLARLWQEEFAWRLSRQAGRRMTRRMIADEIDRLPPAAMPGTDAAKAFNLTLAQSLHAAVRLLEGETTATEARDTAGKAFVDTGSWLSRGMVRLWLRVERDPHAGVVRRGAAPFTRALWGNGMAVEDRHSDGGVSLCVLTCPFHDHFWNAGRADLTAILCRWDTAWQREINASPAPIQVDIRSTIAGGGDLCEFAFRKGGDAA